MGFVVAGASVGVSAGVGTGEGLGEISHVDARAIRKTRVSSKYFPVMSEYGMLSCDDGPISHRKLGIP